jgi:chromosome segregation ATPase
MTTETQTQTKTDTIAELEAAVREASAHERELAQEVDALPQKIREAAREDGRSKATAARSGEAVAAVEKESEVTALRQREAELPFRRWSAAIRTAALEVELNEAHKAEQERIAAEALPKLQPAQEAADEAIAKANKVRSDYHGAEAAASRFSYYASEARKRLAKIEQDYPGA